MASDMSQVKNQQDGRIVLVRAYLVAVSPGNVVAIKKDGEWHLPGGVVEGLGNPVKDSAGSHFEPLAWHLMHQTGLVLTGLSKAIGMQLNNGPEGLEATVFYAGGVSGEQSDGEKFPCDSIPELAPSLGITADEAKQICRRL